MVNSLLKIKVNKGQTRLVRLVCLVLSIVLAAGFGFSAFADTNTEKYGKGYTWTRIRTQADLEKWEKGLALKGDKNYANDNDWVRALFIYNGKYYIDGYRLDGSGEYRLPRVDSNEKFLGNTFPITSGVDISKDTFNTRSGLNTPFIKLRGWDGDNNCYKFAVRMALADEMSKTLWLENLSWYGKAWHAAAYSEYRFCNYDNISAYEASCCCSADVMTDVSLQFVWNNDYQGYVHPFYNIPGVVDRCWNHDGGQVISSSKSEDDDESCFLLYLGYPCDVPIETQSGPIEVGQTTVWNGKIVARNTEIIVPAGATLVIDGKCYNNGKITVDGGTMIVKGVLDMDLNQPNSASYQFPPGALAVKNKGLLVVENTGCILQRHNETGVAVSNNSNMIVYGSAVLGGYLNVYATSRFESDFGSFVGIGLQPSTSLEQTKYSPLLLKEYKNYYGDNIFSVSFKTMSKPGTYQSFEQGLFLSGKSAAYFNGGVFMSTDFSATNSDSAWSGRRSTNIYATVGSMIVE